jgi:hypothetical protein
MYMHDSSKDTPVDESGGGLEFQYCIRVCIRVCVVVRKKLWDRRECERFNGFIASFVDHSRGPSIVCEELIDVGLTRDLNVLLSLFDVYAVERFEYTFIA